MKTSKRRLTVTVDPALVRAAADAVAAGHADSMSAWVNLALGERAAKERRLRALGDAIAAYEARFGAITPEELAAQEREDRRVARVVDAANRSTGIASAPKRTQRRGRARSSARMSSAGTGRAGRRGGVA